MSAVVVISARPPAITWRCPRCPSRIFDCSEKIRANSNGKLVDIWSIYRCRSCSSTKNITVVERRPVSKVPRAVLDAAQTNDGAVARRWARDVALLRRNGAAVAEGDDWSLVGSPVDVDELVFPEPLLVDLVHVVAAAMGLSRGATRSLGVPRGLRLVGGWKA